MNSVSSLALLFAGFLFSLLAALLAGVGLSSDSTGVLWISWALAALGGPVFFVGLIAVGVEVGARSSER